MRYISPAQYVEVYERYAYDLWYVWYPNTGKGVVRGWRYRIEGGVASPLFETRTLGAKAARHEIRRLHTVTANAEIAETLRAASKARIETIDV